MKIQTLPLLAVLVFASGLQVHGQAAAKGGKSAIDAWSTATAQDDGSGDSEADTGSTKKPKKGSSPSNGAARSNPQNSKSGTDDWNVPTATASNPPNSKSGTDDWNVPTATASNPPKGGKSATDDWSSQTDAAGTSGSGADASATVRRRKSNSSVPNGADGNESPKESLSVTKPTDGSTANQATANGDKPNESRIISPPTPSQVGGDKPTESLTKTSASTSAATIVKTHDSSSPAAVLYCRKAGKDQQGVCDANDVGTTNQAIVAGRRQHTPLATVDSVSLSANGRLTCKQTNGAACTNEQLTAIQQLPNTSVTFNTFNMTKKTDNSTPMTMPSATGGTPTSTIRITRPIDSTSPK